MMQQMMQMQQMSQMMQMQQSVQNANQQPQQQPASVAAPVVVTKIILVKPPNDGKLVHAEGQRTSIQIKVELDAKKEPTGDYATAGSVRAKAAMSFPVDGTWGWKLYVGELCGDEPSNITFISGDGDAAMDSTWREAFSCMVITGSSPVVFTHPCVPGSEGRDVDRLRKRSAAVLLEVDKAEAVAAASVLAAARPAQHGMGQSSTLGGKSVAQLNSDSRVVRLREKVMALVNSAQEARYMDPSTGKSILILTNGKWVPAVRSADGLQVITAGYYPEIKVEDIDSSFLDAAGFLKTEVLYFACRCPPCVRKAGTGAFSAKPTGRAAAAGKKQAPPCSWFRSEVRMMSSGGKHSSTTKDGGVVLVSLWTMLKAHMESEHGGGFDVIDGNKAASTAKIFSIGSALLQTPAAQASLQAAATALQSDAAVQPPLTPADPPEPPPVALRYPFDAPADAKERDVAEIPLVDISTAKLAPGSMVSWRVFDLLRRYELQCAINQGLSSKQVLVMPPYDFLQIDRQIVLFEKNNVVTDLSIYSQFPMFELLNSLQEQVGLASSLSCHVIESSSEGQPFTIRVQGLEGLRHPFGELQFVSIPVISDVHDSEYIWLPGFDVAFSLDSYPELHKLHVSRLHNFVQHVACSTVELVTLNVPHQPKEGAQKNVCAFSSSLFLQLALKLLREHGPIPSFVQAMRELTVDESEYHKYRKQAAKEINSLLREYGRVKQAARIEARERAKAGKPGTSNM